MPSPTGSLTEIDVEDLAEITLRFENGVIGSVHLDFFNSRRRTGWRSRHCRFNPLDNANRAARVYDANDGRWDDIQPPADFERNALFLAEMRHF